MILAFADFYAPQLYNPHSNEQLESFKDYTLQLAWGSGSPLCVVAISYNLRKPEGSLYFVNVVIF